MDLNPALNSPLVGFWIFTSPFSSDEALQIGGLFRQRVSFHIVEDMRQGESNIFQISTGKLFFLKYTKKNYEKSDRFR